VRKLKNITLWEYSARQLKDDKKMTKRAKKYITQYDNKRKQLKLP